MVRDTVVAKPLQGHVIREGRSARYNYDVGDFGHPRQRLACSRHRLDRFENRWLMSFAKKRLELRVG
jgi:hypothetical protein